MALGIEAGQVYVPVRPDLSGFQTQMTQGVTTAAQGTATSLGGKLKGYFSSVGGQLAGGFVSGFAAVNAARAVKDFVADSINAASDLNESLNKTRVVFTESADDIIEWSETTAQSFGISQQAALESAGTFGNLFDAMGLAESAGGEMSKTLVELAADLASFNNATPEEVLEALQSGLIGNVRPLRRFGIEVSEAALKEEALRQGITESTQTMSLAEKVQLRYALILGQTSNAQGDFARTSDDLANQQRILAAQFEDVKAEIGQQLLPVVLDITSYLNDLTTVVLSAAQGFENFDESVKEAAISVGEFALEGSSALLDFAGQVPILRDLVNVGKSVALMFQDTSEEAKLTRYEIDQLKNAFAADPNLIPSYVDRIEELAFAFFGLDNEAAELRQGTANVTRSLIGFFGTFDEQPIEVVTDAIAAQRSELRKLRLEQLAYLDPVFATIQAFKQDAEAERAVAEAQRTLNRLRQRGKTDTKEYREALQTLDDANLSAIESHAGLLAQAEALRQEIKSGNIPSMKDAKVALRDMATAAGISGDQWKTLWDYVKGATNALTIWNRTPMDDKNAAVNITVDIARNIAVTHTGFDPGGNGGGNNGPNGRVAAETDRLVLDLEPAATSGRLVRGELVIKDWRSGLVQLEGEMDWNDWSGRG